MLPRADHDLGSFHVHRGHSFEGFEILASGTGDLLVARCECGTVLDVADAHYARCPLCDPESGSRLNSCVRCGGSGTVVDHAALKWRLPDETEGRDAGTGQEPA